MSTNFTHFDNLSFKNLFARGPDGSEITVINSSGLFVDATAFTAILQGDLTLGTSTTSVLNVEGAAAFKSNVAISGTLSVLGVTTLKNNVTASGTLTVRGNSSLRGTVTIGSAATTVTHSLNGKLTVGTTLGVGNAPSTVANLYINTSKTTGVNQFGVYCQWVPTTAGTISAKGYVADINIPNSSYTVTDAVAYDGGFDCGAAATITRATIFDANRGFGGGGTYTSKAILADNHVYSGSYALHIASISPTNHQGPFVVGAVNGFTGTNYLIRATTGNVNTLTGVTQYGIGSDPTLSSQATTVGHAFFAQLQVKNSSFTLPVWTNYASTATVKGAGATVTRAVGFRQTNAMTTVGAANSAILSDNITFTGDWAVNLASTLPSSLAGPICNPKQEVASAAAVNDLAVTSSFVKLTGSTATTLSGVAAGKDGQRLTIWNPTGANLTIKHQGTASVAANRIITCTGADVATTADGAAELIYDSGASRWICLYVTA